MIYIQKIGEVMRLSFSLAKVNFKLRNEGSYLGVLWYLLNPLLLFVTILFVKNQAFDHVEIPYYPLYLLLGLLMYNFFAQVTTSAIEIVLTNAQFIKSIQIKTESLVISRLLQSIFSHIFECVFILAGLFYFGLNIFSFMFYLLIFLLFTLFILGISFILATIGVYIIDFKNIWTVFLQLIFFITPIFYRPIQGSLLYEVNQYNPLSHFIEISRNALIYHADKSVHIFELTFVSLGMFCIGLFVFSRYKKGFAEQV